MFETLFGEEIAESPPEIVLRADKLSLRTE